MFWIKDGLQLCFWCKFLFLRPTWVKVLKGCSMLWEKVNEQKKKLNYRVLFLIIFNRCLLSTFLGTVFFCVLFYVFFFF